MDINRLTLKEIKGILNDVGFKHQEADKYLDVDTGLNVRINLKGHKLCDLLKWLMEYNCTKTLLWKQYTDPEEKVWNKV